MHQKFTAPPSTFPILSAFRNTETITPIKGTEAWTSRVSGKLLNAMDAFPPLLWTVQNVVDSLPDSADFADLNLYNIPSVPPFDSIWMEYTASSGFPNAIYVARQEHPAMHGHDAFLIYCFIHRSVMLLPSEARVQFSDDGILETHTRGVPAELDALPDDVKHALEVDQANAVAIALVSFMFSHCKNVRLEERQPKRHEQRAAERADTPLLSYHQIVIDPSKTRAIADRGDAPNSDNTPKRSMHLARGHFAHYSADRPLFGKYTGTFWRPAHVRGSDKVGIVGKDYAVKAPAKTGRA